jgi:hypothetical protein
MLCTVVNGNIVACRIVLSVKHMLQLKPGNHKSKPGKGQQGRWENLTI